MTVQEYEILAKKCASFQEMTPEIQTQILAARGPEMDSYIQMFTEEINLMSQASQEFTESSDQIVLNFTSNLKSEKAKKLQEDENKSKAEDEKLLQNFFNN